MNGNINQKAIATIASPQPISSNPHHTAINQLRLGATVNLVASQPDRPGTSNGSTRLVSRRRNVLGPHRTKLVAGHVPQPQPNTAPPITISSSIVSINWEPFWPNMNISALSPNTYDERVSSMPRKVVYNNLVAIRVEDGRLPKEVLRLADSLYERIEQMPSYMRHYQEKKRRYWRRLVGAGVRAFYAGGCVRYSRQNGNGSKLRKRTVQCAIEAGFFCEYRSPPGSPKQSRLLPTTEFCRLVPRDPWQFKPPPTEYVRMRSRKTKEDLSFDPAHPIAVETGQKLALVNRVNAACEISYCPESGLYSGRFRPVQYALFHEEWEHGRMYWDNDGSGTSLRKNERQTITFDGEPSIELDYVATHPRLAYHLHGLEYPGDPYHLFGERTTESQRKLAKLVVNIALNAKSRRAALGACRQAIRLRTKDDSWKQGNKRERAMQLRKALYETIGFRPNRKDFFRLAGEVFSDLYDLAIECHRPIASEFGSDAGAKLMGIESRIALDVMYHCAAKGIPVLGVHDSFIVPESHGDELREAMHDYYRAKLGFDPVVK